MAIRTLRPSFPAGPAGPSPLPSKCDAQCYASALVEVTSSRSGLVLMFCGHHYRDNGPVLSLLGWKITIDRREVT